MGTINIAFGEHNYYDTVSNVDEYVLVAKCNDDEDRYDVCVMGAATKGFLSEAALILLERASKQCVRGGGPM